MSATICSGGSFTLTPLNGTDGIVPTPTTYTWPAPVITGSLTGIAAGAGGSINGTLTNTSNVVQTATYTVTPTSGSCTGNTFTVTVTVNPKATITDMTAVICSGGTFTTTPVESTNGIVPAGTTYSWSAPSVTGGISGGAAGSGALNISGTLTNPMNTPQTATYTVTPLSGTCTGPTFTVTVTVNPMPAVTNMTATICSGETFTSTPANSTNGVVPAGTTYSWLAPSMDAGVAGGSAGTNAANISGTLTNSTNSALTATYTVTPMSGSCTGATFTVTVTVNPMPSINNQASTICSGSTFTITPANLTDGVVPSGTTYTWTMPVLSGAIVGAMPGSGTSVSGTLTNMSTSTETATYTVTPKSGSCTGVPFTVVVTVNPLTGLTTFTAGAPEVCQDAVNETYTATADNSTSIAYSVLPITAGVIDPVTGVMNWDAAFYGNATITATSTGICNTTSKSMVVRVKRLPSIISSPLPVVTCEYGIVSFEVDP